MLKMYPYDHGQKQGSEMAMKSSKGMAGFF